MIVGVGVGWWVEGKAVQSEQMHRRNCFFSFLEHHCCFGAGPEEALNAVAWAWPAVEVGRPLHRRLWVDSLVPVRGYSTFR